MAELVFYYGTMASSKTANALMKRFQYVSKGLEVLLIKPKIDNRSGERTVSSRVGISAEADLVIEPDKDMLYYWHKYLDDNEVPAAIIVDEAQFLTGKQVEDLKIIAEEVDIPVYCYGLRTDFKSKLFEGSKRLFELASRVIEIESICENCGKPAIINAKYSKGRLVTNGAQIDIGGDEKYKAICYTCYVTAKENAELIPGENYWPGCGTSVTELVQMANHPQLKSKKEAQEYLDKLLKGKANE